MTQIVVGIDCQNGFASPDGGLFVLGSDVAMTTFAAGIEFGIRSIDEMLVTFDWHSRGHMLSTGSGRIVNASSGSVDGYTQITREQVLSGEYRAATVADQSWFLQYVDLLEKNGKKDLMVWPEHCVAGRFDARLYHAILQAVTNWEQYHQKRVLAHFKGLCPDREQYGAFGDEVPDRVGIMRFDTEIVNYILSFDRKLWGGLVLSHCLMASFDQAMSKESLGRYHTHVILRDCTTIVPGFEEPTEAWLKAWQEKGVQVMNIADALPA